MIMLEIYVGSLLLGMFIGAIAMVFIEAVMSSQQTDFQKFFKNKKVLIGICFMDKYYSKIKKISQRLDEDSARISPNEDLGNRKEFNERIFKIF